MTYLIELYNPQGERLADISKLCVTRTYQVRRNRAEDIYLTLNLEEAQQLAEDLGMNFYQLFAAGITEVRITRGNRPMVGGQLMYVHPRLNREGATLELRASGFLELFSKRFISDDWSGLIDYDQNRNFVSYPLGSLAWRLIEQSQEAVDGFGDFGITEGTIQSSRSIDQMYARWGQSIKEILIGLTERIDGIDFEFTPNKVFNTYYPGIGTDKTELLFSYPGSVTNIGLPVDATTLVNYSVVRGQGNGEVQPLEKLQDEASLATYAVRQRIDDYPSVSQSDTLEEKAQEVLRLYANPTMIPSVTLDGSKEPFLGSYWIGDRVRFSVDTDRYPAFALLDGQTWRINEISCVVDENDHEEITLKVGYS